MATSAMAGFAASPAAAQGATAQHDFDIPAQSLAQALMIFGRQAGLQVTAEGSATSGKTSAAVKGSFAPAEALSRLLTGTGLTFRFVGNNGVQIEAAPQSANGSIQLGPVRVEGSSETSNGGQASLTTKDAVTEGSRSYTTRAVTIGKTVQSLREIPQSVSVMTRQRIEDQNLTTLGEVLDQAAGVYVQVGAPGISPGYTSRGYDMRAQYDGVPGTGTIEATNAFDMAMYDRIEILRGPAGLLQGSGEPGGVVNLVRKRPLDHFALSGSLQAGSWNSYRGDFDISAPLTRNGDLRGRFVVAHQDKDFFYDVSHDRRTLAYGALAYDVTPSTTVTLMGSFQKEDGRGIFYGLPTYDDGSFLDVPRSTYLGGDWSFNDTRKLDGAVEIEQSLGGRWTLKVAAHASDWDYDQAYAYPYTTISGATGNAGFLYARTYNNNDKVGVDVHVEGPIELWGREHTLLAGYAYDRYDNDFKRGFNTTTTSALNPTLPESLIPVPSSGTRTEQAQSGFYATARLKIFDPITVVIGARVSDYKARTRGIAPSTPTDWSVNSQVKDKWGFNGAVLWDIQRHLTAYASYADIFVPQTTIDISGKTLEPRVGGQAEVGLKGEYFDGRLNASIAAFRLRDRNRSMVDPDNIGCGGTGGTCYMAAGLVRSQGVEAEITGSPLSGLELSASYTRNDTKVLRASNGAGEGQTFTSTIPRDMFKLWGRYTFDEQQFQGWNIGFGLRAQSRTYTTFSNGSLMEQGSYAVASAQIGYQINNSFHATLTVNNIFDKTYYARINSAAQLNYFGEPRSVTLTLRGHY